MLLCRGLTTAHTKGLCITTSGGTKATGCTASQGLVPAAGSNALAVSTTSTQPQCCPSLQVRAGMNRENFVNIGIRSM
jgi:hypothetical protein